MLVFVTAMVDVGGLCDELDCCGTPGQERLRMYGTRPSRLIERYVVFDLDAVDHDVSDAGKSGEAGAEARQPGLSTQSFRSIVDSTPLLRIMLLLRYTCIPTIPSPKRQEYPSPPPP
jgi:hypothetical protein